MEITQNQREEIKSVSNKKINKLFQEALEYSPKLLIKEVKSGKYMLYQEVFKLHSFDNKCEELKNVNKTKDTLICYLQGVVDCGREQLIKKYF